MTKKNITIAIIFSCLSIASFAQDTIAGWQFLNNTSNDKYANIGIVDNVGLSDIRASDNNYNQRELSFIEHDDDYAIQAQEWNDGKDYKFWKINFKASQYKDIKISSSQRSDGIYCGPRDFKMQYKLNNNEWIDIDNGTVLVKNDWETGIVSNIALPEECNEYPNNIFIRWLITSDSSAYGTIVNEEGKSWIDNIIVTGTYVIPNPNPILAGWTFPNAFISSHNCDTCIAINSEYELEYWNDNTGETTNYPLAGGYSSYCAKGVNWTNGENNKYWMIKFKTEGYDNINISSRQLSPETKPGPAEFKIQYKIGGNEWSDIDNSIITVDDDWNTGRIDALALPQDCWDTTASIYVRWLAITNTDFNGNNVNANSISLIDDIIVRGQIETSGIDEQIVNISIYPIPAHHSFVINSEEKPNNISIYSIDGKLIERINTPNKKQIINTSSLKTGLYFVNIDFQSYSTSKKIIIK